MRRERFVPAYKARRAQRALPALDAMTLDLYQRLRGGVEVGFLAVSSVRLEGAVDGRSRGLAPAPPACSAGTSHPAEVPATSATPGLTVYGRCIGSRPDASTGLLTPNREVADPRSDRREAV